MKITYEFVTGEISEVEVEESLGGMLLDLDRQQYNNDHTSPTSAGSGSSNRGRGGRHYGRKGSRQEYQARVLPL